MNQNDKLREAFNRYQEKCQAAKECQAALEKADIQVANAYSNIVQVIAALGRKNTPIIYNGWVYHVDANGDLNICEHKGVIL